MGYGEEYKGVCMKKLKFLLGIVIIFCLTGCIKYNAVMDIKKDKSMDFSITYAMQKSMLEMSDDKSILSDEDKKNLENNGFSISDYSDDEMVGFIISKAISNIDDVSSSEDVQYSLSNMMEANADQSRMFKVEKSKDKNTYTANFIFDASDSDLSDGEEETTELTDGVTIEQTEEVDVETSGDLDKLGESLTASMDLKFVVKLPDGAISSNATSKSKDGKELTWNLSTNKEDSISFQFSLSNSGATALGKTLTNVKDSISGNLIYIIVGGVVLCAVIVILIVVSNHNNKTGTQTVNNVNANSSLEANDSVNNVVKEQDNLVSGEENIVEEPVVSVNNVENVVEQEVVKEKPVVSIFDEKKVEEQVENKVEEKKVSSEIFPPVNDDKN